MIMIIIFLLLKVIMRYPGHGGYAILPYMPHVLAPATNISNYSKTKITYHAELVEQDADQQTNGNFDTSIPHLNMHLQQISH